MAGKQKSGTSNRKKWVLIVVSVLLVGALTGCSIWPLNSGSGDGTQQSDNTAPTDNGQSTLPTGNAPLNSGETDLGQGLYISKVEKYAGMFMEDGTNDLVTGAMMIILRNTSDKDLQLARIKLPFDDYVAEFEVTNIPAGESVVALEKNRREYTDKPYQEASAQDVIFFTEPMSIQENQLKITGGDGYLDVKNISDTAVGLVYLYYKNSATDLLYGGITYRAKIADGIQPGQTMRVAAGHYSPTTCRVMMVQIEDTAA